MSVSGQLVGVSSEALDTKGLADAANDKNSPWWKGAVIYQVYPRSFKDSNGDGIGDIPGIISELDYIAQLGVDAVWLSPFFKSPQRDFGYDISDYCDVDPIFGTLEDFDRLVEKAHALGLKIIVDQVYSHTSDQHAWFQESRQDKTNPKADWYVWADAKPDGSPPSNWQSVFGGIAWEWDARRQQYYLHNFLREQPDLNVHNPEVRAAIEAAVQFWVDRGVDGFRLDAINFAMHDPEFKDNPPSDIAPEDVTRPFDMQKHTYNQSHAEITSFIEGIRGVLDQAGGKFTVAEVGGPDPIDEMKAFTRGNNRLDSAYNFDFLYADRLTGERIKTSLGQWSGAKGEGWPAWAFSNHDAPRAISRWAGADAREKAAKAILMTLLSLRGTSFIYQGEELGLPQSEVAFEDLQDPEAIANWPRTLGRDGARTPMPWQSDQPNAGFCQQGVKPWLPVDDVHSRMGVDVQINDPTSMLSFTKTALKVRSANTALRVGEIKFLEAPEDVIACVRTSGKYKILCVCNVGLKRQTWKPAEYQDAKLILKSDENVQFSDVLEPWDAYWAILGA